MFSSLWRVEPAKCGRGVRDERGGRDGLLPLYRYRRDERKEGQKNQGEGEEAEGEEAKVGEVEGEEAEVEVEDSLDRHDSGPSRATPTVTFCSLVFGGMRRAGQVHASRQAKQSKAKQSKAAQPNAWRLARLHACWKRWRRGGGRLDWRL